jgi:hypothetical protein
VRSAYVKSFNSDAGDALAQHVAVWGDTMVATSINESGSSKGVNGTDDNTVETSGAAYVFR